MPAASTITYLLLLLAVLQLCCQVLLLLDRLLQLCLSSICLLLRLSNLLLQGGQLLGCSGRRGLIYSSKVSNSKLGGSVQTRARRHPTGKQGSATCTPRTGPKQVQHNHPTLGGCGRLMSSTQELPTPSP